MTSEYQKEAHQQRDDTNGVPAEWFFDWWSFLHSRSVYCQVDKKSFLRVSLGGVPIPNLVIENIIIGIAT